MFRCFRLYIDEMSGRLVCTGEDTGGQLSVSGELSDPAAVDLPESTRKLRKAL